MSIPESILREIENNIGAKLNQCGLMFHIFSRVKKDKSIKIKLDKKQDEYRSKNKKMQDYLALRITLYFSDDVDLVYRNLERLAIDKSVDEMEVDRFCPKRLNLIMRLPEDKVRDFNFAINTNQGIYAKLIDATYEIQIRTILSEGWHEVEHDLRYKCKEDWEGLLEDSRHLNGIYATLENAEWSMLSLFERLAHSHYKTHNWNSMLRNKMRVRFANNSLSDELISYLDNNSQVAKRLFRVDRGKVISLMLENGFKFPLTYDSMLHFLNYIEVKDEGLSNLADKMLIEEFDKVYEIG
jgi:hypothetical protein